MQNCMLLFQRHSSWLIFQCSYCIDTLLAPMLIIFEKFYESCRAAWRIGEPASCMNQVCLLHRPFCLRHGSTCLTHDLYQSMPEAAHAEGRPCRRPPMQEAAHAGKTLISPVPVSWLRDTCFLALIIQST